MEIHFYNKKSTAPRFARMAFEMLRGRTPDDIAEEYKTSAINVRRIFFVWVKKDILGTRKFNELIKKEWHYEEMRKHGGRKIMKDGIAVKWVDGREIKPEKNKPVVDKRNSK